jgi:hypothetical protein
MVVAISFVKSSRDCAEFWMKMAEKASWDLANKKIILYLVWKIEIITACWLC